jgi:hypothetical protein
MPKVTTREEILEASKKAVNALYGSNVQEFKIREVFPYAADQILSHSEEEDSSSPGRDGWDVQVTFLLEGMQYTVDLLILEKDGQITYSRLIDKMVPL